MWAAVWVTWNVFIICFYLDVGGLAKVSKVEGLWADARGHYMHLLVGHCPLWSIHGPGRVTQASPGPQEGLRKGLGKTSHLMVRRGAVGTGGQVVLEEGPWSQGSSGQERQGGGQGAEAPGLRGVQVGTPPGGRAVLWSNPLLCPADEGHHIQAGGARSIGGEPILSGCFGHFVRRVYFTLA